MWHEIAYPIPKSNGANVEVLGWISNSTRTQLSIPGFKLNHVSKRGPRRWEPYQLCVFGFPEGKQDTYTIYRFSNADTVVRVHFNLAALFPDLPIWLASPETRTARTTPQIYIVVYVVNMVVLRSPSYCATAWTYTSEIQVSDKYIFFVASLWWYR